MDNNTALVLIALGFFALVGYGFFILNKTDK